MSNLFSALAPSLFVFVLFVVPIWLVLHYRSRRGDAAQSDEQANSRLLQLQQQAQALEQRLQVLEQLLDQDDPHWREKL